MNTLFTEADYKALAAIVFRPDYPGNATARGVVEAPNGDGKLDTTKRYAHVASKYLAKMNPRYVQEELDRYDTLANYLVKAYRHAVDVATRLGIPAEFMPHYNYGALRVLEYPAGAGSEVHTDVGLLTLNLWRNQPEKLVSVVNKENVHGVPPFHLGRLAREIGISSAVPHFVDPSPTVQRSLVYFAVPNWAATLPSGQNLGEWLQGEMSKMRYDATEVGKS